MLLMMPLNAQLCAQNTALRGLGFSQSRARATFAAPASVPSFNRAGGNVTCYPSPLKRPVCFGHGPSFSRGHMWREKHKKRAEISCRHSKSPHSLRLSPWRSRAVWPMTSNAPGSARQQVRAPRLSLMAAWAPAFLSAASQARFATTLTCAEYLTSRPAKHSGAEPTQADHRGVIRPAGLFLFAETARALPARDQG